jgi:dTMP kinase
MVVGASLPDLTFILDVDPYVGMRRAIRRSYGDVRESSYLMSPEQLAFGFAPDRFEGLDIEYHRSVRGAFLAIAEREPERCVVIDSSVGVAQVAETIWDVVVSRFGSTEPIARRRIK